MTELAAPLGSVAPLHVSKDAPRGTEAEGLSGSASDGIPDEVGGGPPTSSKKACEHASFNVGFKRDNIMQQASSSTNVIVTDFGRRVERRVSSFTIPAFKVVNGKKVMAGIRDEGSIILVLETTFYQRQPPNEKSTTVLEEASQKVHLVTNKDFVRQKTWTMCSCSSYGVTLEVDNIAVIATGYYREVACLPSILDSVAHAGLFLIRDPTRGNGVERPSQCASRLDALASGSSAKLHRGTPKRTVDDDPGSWLRMKRNMVSRRVGEGSPTRRSHLHRLHRGRGRSPNLFGTVAGNV